MDPNQFLPLSTVQADNGNWVVRVHDMHDGLNESDEDIIARCENQAVAQVYADQLFYTYLKNLQREAYRTDKKGFLQQ